MSRFYLVADRCGWHHPAHRPEMSFDCGAAAKQDTEIQWTSVLDTVQHVDLVQQWMSESNGLPLSDEWIPAEWLLRVWDSPAMAAAETTDLDVNARLFEVEAEPVLLARSIPVLIPELGLGGVDQLKVIREVPPWWLMGPCGREALALLIQFHNTHPDMVTRSMSLDAELSTLRGQARRMVDVAGRVGAYVLARSATHEREAPVDHHRQFALDAATGFLLKDVWPDAPRLYRPWVEHYGLPDLAAAVEGEDLPYPA